MSWRHGPSLGLDVPARLPRWVPSRGHRGPTGSTWSKRERRSRAARRAGALCCAELETDARIALPSGAVSTFAVKFLGCKVSQADAMIARDRLLEAGHVEVPEADAELHVVNTCCITGEAEAKSRQSVRRSLRSAREVYVGGCAVHLNARPFGEIDPTAP